jgi:hypothetical protein
MKCRGYHETKNVYVTRLKSFNMNDHFDVIIVTNSAKEGKKKNNLEKQFIFIKSDNCLKDLSVTCFYSLYNGHLMLFEYIEPRL